MILANVFFDSWLKTWWLLIEYLINDSQKTFSDH